MILLVLTLALLLATHGYAQESQVWTRQNIQEWIDSNAQKRAKRHFIQHVATHDRHQFDKPDWFFPPQMYVSSSKPGQLGRLVFPAYKVIRVVDEQRVMIEVTNEHGHRYLIVFDIGDTSRVKMDHLAHISPEIYKYVLFERVEDYSYRNTSNIRKVLPQFRELDPAELVKDASE
jgi:hypothetical protein